MLVRMSIIKPLTDQRKHRCFKYRAIRMIKTKKQVIPKRMLTGYSIGYLDTSLKAIMANQLKAQVKPNAPIADKLKDIAEVFTVRHALTVFENIKQNSPVTAIAMPENNKHVPNMSKNHVSFSIGMRSLAINKTVPDMSVDKVKCLSFMMITALE